MLVASIHRSVGEAWPEARSSDAIQRALTPDERALEKIRGQGKLTARERIDLLLDAGTFVEDGVLANAMAAGLPADGVVTGRGTIDGMPAVVVANDPMVKAGSWGARTVEKMLRASEAALAEQVPIVWLVDSAGARLTDQVQLFPGRRGAGHIFYNQVKLSGPGAPDLLPVRPVGGRRGVHPVVLRRRVHGRGQRLDVPRVAADGRDGRRRDHDAGGDGRGADARLAVRLRRQPGRRRRGRHRAGQGLPVVLPADVEGRAAGVRARAAGGRADRRLRPGRRAGAVRHAHVIDGIVDRDSFFEVKPLFARELIVGLGRLDGHPVGIVANNSAHLAGTLFVDSADKAARFIWCCDAFNIPLVFLADVPGFMIGSAVERQGIIRHGAKMVTAVSEATVPKVSVVVRKAYGAGLYAMSGPAFEPAATIALPTARIAVMGPEAAINAVYANKIAAIADPIEREEFVAEQRAIYETDVDLLRLASELVIDAIIEPSSCAAELIRRIERARHKERHFADRRHGIPPV